MDLDHSKHNGILTLNQCALLLQNRDLQNDHNPSQCVFYLRHIYGVCHPAVYTGVYWDIDSIKNKSLN